MTEQINMDNLILNIMYGLQDIIGEQERLNQAKMVLYMHLSSLQILQGEETALSAELDNTGGVGEAVFNDHGTKRQYPKINQSL